MHRLRDSETLPEAVCDAVAASVIVEDCPERVEESELVGKECVVPVSETVAVRDTGEVTEAVGLTTVTVAERVAEADGADIESVELEECEKVCDGRVNVRTLALEAE